jgi:urea transporter
MTIMAVVLANATAFWLGIRHKPIRSGVFGGPAFIMAALTSRLTNPAEMWNWKIALLIAFGSPMVVVINLALGNFWIPHFRMPPLSLPALFVVWMSVNMLYLSPNLSNAPYQTEVPTMSATQPMQNPGPAATFVDGDLMLRGIFNGIAAISVMHEWHCGVIILAGIFCFSRISAINCVWAGAVSTLVAVAIGVPTAEIAAGQYSFQAASVAMALCGMFYVVTVTTFVNALFAVTFEVMLNVLIRTVWNLVGLNPTGFPGSITIWLFLGMQGSFRGAPPVALTEISTPERHLKLHWVRKKGRSGTSSLFIRNTGLDPAKLL